MKKACIALAFSLVVAKSLYACFWDYDTLEMERQQFPATLELITGKFLRHSEKFYQWRIENRLNRLEAKPDNVQLLDDLAVAYDKVGQHDKAIDVALEMRKEHPDRYETAANLGTFFIHAGRFEEGLVEIKRALAINPDAHFGREEYQQLLVEYLLEQKSTSEAQEQQSDRSLENFARFVFREKRIDEYSESAERETQKAIKGILGMMRFGNFDSPILLEALGDLLSSDGWEHPSGKAGHLAARAYLKALYESGSDEAARERLIEKANEAISSQLPGRGSGTTPIQLSTIEREFKQELEEAETWHQSVANDESRWIEEGKNADEEFSKKYYKEPSISQPNQSRFMQQTAILLGLIAVAVSVYVLRRRK